MRSGLAIRPEDFDRPESRKLLINFAIMIAERQGQEETFFLHLIMLRWIQYGAVGLGRRPSAESVVSLEVHLLNSK